MEQSNNFHNVEPEKNHEDLQAIDGAYDDSTAITLEEVSGEL